MRADAESRAYDADAIDCHERQLLARVERGLQQIDGTRELALRDDQRRRDGNHVACAARLHENKPGAQCAANRPLCVGSVGELNAP